MLNRYLGVAAVLAVVITTGCGEGEGASGAWARVQQALGTPAVTSFSPATGAAGTSVTLTGTNFTGATTVRFNGTAASTLTVVSDTQLTAVVPNGATTGRVSVTHPSEGTGTSAGDFTVPTAAPPPSIDSVSPLYGQAGASVTLEGAHLASATVRFGGNVTGTITSNTATQIVVTVPATARSGALTVTTAAGSTSSPGAFTVLAGGAPTLTSFTPATGGLNTQVTLTGTNLRSVSEVTFNGVPASTVFASSDTSLTAYVPAGASTGLIRLYNALGSAVSGTSFTIKPAPKVTSFSPMAGVPGTTVTIEGENFTGVTSVAFYNKTASATVVSPTRITATVPAGANTGPLYLTSPNGTTTTQARFTVLSSAPPAITSFTPGSASTFTSVTVTGTNFTGTQEVTLNGTPVISLSVSSDTSLSFYVSPGNHTTGRLRVTNTAGSGVSSTDFVLTPPAPPPPAPSVSEFSPTSGTNGTLVAVTGSGFTGATAVRFNGLQAQSFTVLDDSHLSAVVPAGATKGKVAVYKSSASGSSTSDFVVEGAAPPVITSFSPTSGTGYVVLQGAYFTGVTSVKFNGVNAGFFSVEGDGRLTAYTPYGAFTSGKLTVTNSAGTGTSTQDFVVFPAPTVASMTPTSGPPGSSVTLTGTGFSRVTSVSMGRPAVFKVLSDTELEVIVPRGTASSPRITLTTASTQVSSPVFTVTAEAAPTITSFTPERGFADTYVTLYGANFSGATEVSFNGVSVSSFSVQNDGLITVVAPYGVSTGPILVRNSAGSTPSSVPFVVPSLPAVSSFSPASGPAGTLVTVHGTGFSDAQNVQFAKSLAASFYVRSDTELTAIVPSGAVSGPLSVGISSYGPRNSSAESFTVTSACTPTVSSFTPTKSGINRSVSITGTCFTGTTALRFGGVDAVFFNVYSDTSMGAQVPPGAVTGPLSVVNTLGTGSSAESFTVIPPPLISSFTPVSGGAGTVVTLTGTGLATTSSVVLNNNLNVSFSVISDTELTVTLPPGATTGRFTVSTGGGYHTTSRSFIVLSAAAPTVTSFSPASGGGGTYVQLTGTGFTGATAVRFNGVASYQVSVTSDTQLSTYVPSGARTGPITVENTLGAGTSSASFTVLPLPSVVFFSPAQGPAGTVVTVEGRGFTGTTLVRINGFNASFTVVNDNRLIITVPHGVTSGQIAIQAPGGYVTSSDRFTVLSTEAPTITGISPASGAVYTTVTLTGTGFTGATRVSFNGAELTSFYATNSTELRVSVPPGATTGPVAVTNTVGTATSSTHFTVLPTLQPPAISSFSPASGPAGSVVTINGTGFTGLQNIYFEGSVSLSAASFKVVSDTQVTAVVPGGATTGLLSASSAAGRGASSSPFTVLSSELPVVELFTPSSARPGREVTLLGSGFTGTTRVALNGIPIEGLRVSSDQELRVTVPVGATSGPFTVQNSMGEVSSTSSFTVLPVMTISSFTPAAGGVGTQVTVKGTGFTSIYSVRFNNTDTDFTVLSDTELTAVVPSGATSGPIYLLSQLSPSASTSTAFDIAANGAPTLASVSPGSGAVGSKVLLTGTNFTGLTSIRFHGVTAPVYRIYNDTQAVAQVPYGAATGLIQLTNSQGSTSSADVFTVQQPGTISSFTPASGAAGTVVTLTGSGFTGSTSVHFENGLASFTVDHDGQLRATVPAGAVSGVITVTGPGGSFQTASWFRIPSSSAPTVSAVGPTRLGPGQSVTVTGSGFTGATAVRINGTPAESFRILSDTQLRAVVSSHATSGPVSVTTDLGTGVSTSAVTIVPVPVIAGFSPATGAAGTVVTLTGTGFTDVTRVSFGGTLNGSSASFSVVSDTQLTATVPAEAFSGPIRLETIAGVGSSTASFSVQATTAPVIRSLEPALGNVGSLVLISGSGMSGATVRFNGVQADILLSISRDYAYVAVPVGATTGRVTVTNSMGTATSSQDFTINNGYTSIRSVVPGKAPRGAVVTLNGTNLHPSTVYFLGSTMLTAEVRSSSPTRLDVVVPPEATSGLVYVSTTSQAAVALFTVEEPPSGRSVNPPAGATDSSTTITLSGSNFESGATVTFDGVVATSVTYISETELRVVVPQRSTGGAVDISITNPSGLTSVLREGFTYIGPSPAPTVTSTNPSSGPATGGTSVTLKGTGFLTGATVKFSGKAATNVAVINGTTLICTTPALPPGSSTLTVTHADGQSATLAGAFTFVGPPEVTAVAPTSGTSNGGTLVTIDGSGFREGAGVLFGGSPATNVTVEGPTRLTAITPAHAAGAVDVIVRNSDNQSGTLLGGYTYAGPAAPTVTAISPNKGPSTGGTSVTLTGTGFVSGSQVKVGGVAATSVTYVSATQLTAVTGAHAAGPVNVDVVNPDGSAGTLTGGYTYEPEPAPTLTGITPSRGPTSGGTTVTLSGTSFKSGATVLFGGTAGTVTQLSTTSLTVKTPARGSIGAVDVVVRNPDQQTATLLGAFTYDWGAAPVVSSVTPGHGSAGGGTAITVMGSGFVAGATVTLGGTAATSVNVVSSTQLTAITAPRAAGTVAVVVKNTDNQSGTLNNGYTYEPLPVLSLASVSPNNGPASGGTSVTLTGTNFVNGATVKFGTTEAASVTFVSETALTAVTAPQAAGTVEVTVTNPDGERASLASAYTYNPAPAPTVSNLTPDSGPSTGGTLVTLNGAHFVEGVTVTFDGVAATSVTFGSSMSITATTPPHGAGAVVVVVKNPDGQQATATGGFTFIAPPAPSITSLTPVSGPSTGGTAVTINGAHFVEGATVKFGTVPATAVSFGSASSLTATAPAQAAGKVSVTVINPDGQSGTLSNAYTYADAPTLTLTSVTPGSGATNGGTEVTLNGTGFASGATVSFGGVPATGVVVASAMSISARTPTHLAGKVDVVVRNPDGKQATLSSGYTYVPAPAPTISQLSPNTGAPEGGLTVTLTGTNFVPGATVKFGSAAATQVNVASATSLTATTPAMAAGSVMVSVTNPDGQTGSKADGFTYQASGSGGGCSTGGEGLTALALVTLLTLLGRQRRRAGA